MTFYTGAQRFVPVKRALFFTPGLRYANTGEGSPISLLPEIRA